LDRRNEWDPDRARGYARGRYSAEIAIGQVMAVYEEALG
jgi:hypothetical protein